MTRTDNALNWLINATMVEGQEFPDACGRAARMFRVSYDKLRAAYDEYGARKVTKCRWFLKCDNPATEYVPHPVLGEVPCCARCAAFAKGN